MEKIEVSLLSILPGESTQTNNRISIRKIYSHVFWKRVTNTAYKPICGIADSIDTSAFGIPKLELSTTMALLHHSKPSSWSWLPVWSAGLGLTVVD